MSEIDLLKITINQLKNDLDIKNNLINDLKQKLSNIETENYALDKIMGYENMTLEEKLIHQKESQKEENELLLSAEASAIKDYESDIEKEDRMVELALEINRLQFEIGELFTNIKTNIKTDKYDEYKKNKKYWHNFIDSMYDIYMSKEDESKEGYIDKSELFDKLLIILRKQKKCYMYDEELKYIK